MQVMKCLLNVTAVDMIIKEIAFRTNIYVNLANMSHFYNIPGILKTRKKTYINSTDFFEVNKSVLLTFAECTNVFYFCYKRFF